MAMKISDNMVGEITQVLVEGFSKKDSEQLRGKTENNRTVNFTGPASLIGDFAHVLITEALPNSLRAELQQVPVVMSEPTLQQSVL